MNKLKCLIIDDDPLITDLIVHYADKTDEIEYCIACNDAVAGLKLLGNGNFDLLFLDLNMPSLNGKDILDLKQDKSKVIMITSDEQFAVESYRYNEVIDYLLKPISYDKFDDAIKRNNLKQQEESLISKRLMIKDGSKWIPVELDSIHYIKSESNYCMIHTSKAVVMSLVNLKSLLDKLPKYFIQTHRSYIVNTNLIEYLTKEEISISGKLIPISNKYKAEVKSFIESEG